MLEGMERYLRFRFIYLHTAPTFILYFILLVVFMGVIAYSERILYKHIKLTAKHVQIPKGKDKEGCWGV